MEDAQKRGSALLEDPWDSHQGEELLRDSF